MSGKTISCEVIDEVEQPKIVKRTGQTQGTLPQKRQRIAKSLESDAVYESIFTPQQRAAYKCGYCIKKISNDVKQFWATFEMTFINQEIADQWTKELTAKKIITVSAPYSVEMTLPSPKTGCVRVYGSICIRGDHKWDSLRQNVFMCNKEQRTEKAVAASGIIFSSVKFGYNLGAEYVKNDAAAEIAKLKRENDELKQKWVEAQATLGLAQRMADHGGSPAQHYDNYQEQEQDQEELHF